MHNSANQEDPMSLSSAPAAPAQVLAGKVAIVTGGGRGMGRAHAMALAAHGARLVVNATSDSAEQVAAEIRAAGGEAIAHRASVADHAAAGDLIGVAIDHFGRLDILVNNAGFALPKLLQDTTPEDLDDLYAVNLRGHFNTIQHAAKVMVNQHSGRIINTASGSWRRPTGNVAYAASKAAVVSLTWGVAWELRNHGITCNAIAPFGMTRLVQNGVAAYGDLVRTGLMPPGTNEHLMNYPGPEFAAPIVVYLASDAAARVSGQIFRSGGGKVAIFSHPQEINAIQKDISGQEPWTFEELAERIPDDVLGGISPWWSGGEG
jgi:NAD(P)-dependent dehydrogenase (short-subunit alcohol dehydrogenase family)